jgi:hypothetical protein
LQVAAAPKLRIVLLGKTRAPGFVGEKNTRRGRRAR